VNAAPVILADLPGHAFGLVLILARVGGVIMLLPGIGESEVPPAIRAGLALALSLLLLPVVLPLLPRAPDSFAVLAGMVAAEAFAGTLLGWLARLTVLALGMAGQVAAYMLGLSSVLVPDPALGGQSTALERLCILAGIVATMGTGLHALPLRALAASYDLIAPNGSQGGAQGTVLAMDVGEGIDAFVGGVADAFALALRLAAPFVLLGTVFQIALGLLSRLVPRLQVYFVAMPGQILGGFLLFALLASPILGAWHDAAEAVLDRLPGLAWGLP